MKKYKPLILLAVILFIVTLIIPAVLVIPYMEGKVSGKLGEAGASAKEVSTQSNADSGIEVSVYRTSQAKIEKIPLENYLIGVVASEMPADFKEEALKAQALAARTYIVQQMLAKDHLGLPKGAIVGDTEINQVYKSDEELHKIWKMDYSWKMANIKKAVESTSGQIITYQGKPITASFFSTSNGYTENSEDYWPNTFPYLRSVPSPWDIGTEKYNNSKIFSVTEFENKLGVRIGKRGSIGKVVARTAGKRVAKVSIGGKMMTGRDVREKLDLDSTDFSWVRKGDSIIVTTRGYGHGVGMSQYGANGMAQEGKNYEEIVKYYYKGVEISSEGTVLATAGK